jgi:uncharacterized protein (DUF2267 family)
MSQDQKPAGDPNGTDLRGAFRELGENIEAAFKATLSSERIKQARSDLESGVRELASQVSKSVERVQQDPRIQEVEDRGREAFKQAQTNDVVQTLQDALATGISQLNAQLAKLVERLEQDTPAAPSQDIPVEPDAATGETKKLD